MKDEYYIIFVDGRIYDLESIIEKFNTPASSVAQLEQMIENKVTVEEILGFKQYITKDSTDVIISDDLTVIRWIEDNNDKGEEALFWCILNGNMDILSLKEIYQHMEINKSKTAPKHCYINKIKYNSTTDIIFNNKDFISYEDFKRKQKQAEGIKKAKENGKHMGRPKLVMPDNFAEIYTKWKNGCCTAKYAMQLFGISSTSFYRLVKKYEEKNNIK